mmetsp:Transcript_53448/g.148086  ORF Transcript_53448/g.148086 Transcript_53448/m.148086 type:complete len:522 (-) Transcript_53448:157-1722(-)|eukprot:CAMPEP_0179024250 /NCGR_PEP_ID=MMETSP0796-20121207/7358_1 /TAXON_ID=73915 /ORGANISM="Pyrodinium bahamense, Strain pbaha01" /LENGTH=521 /DNA_ID=CAMNT_0020720205 /DNA_START=223 /DNA_END=1788 /DNA_ORIENTATION=-
MGNVCQNQKTGEIEYEHAGPHVLTNYALKNRANALCKMGCGRQVPGGRTRSGKPFDTCCRSCAVSPGAGVHDARCPGLPSGVYEELLPSGALRPVCAKGARCRRRVPEHLAEEAHPLDKDYHECCKAAGVEPEEMSLKLLFDWADADGSGRLSKEELSATLHIINALSGDDVEDAREITDEAWERLDEDGNGLVNFHEFACWAGPRLGLPLGVKKLVFRSASQTMARPCGVYNCPCENFVGGALLFCKCCGHKSSSHVSPTHTGEIPYPDYWENRRDQPHALIRMKDSARKEFQKLVDRTYKNVWTRDRSKHNPETGRKVPVGFKVVAVYRNENRDNWREYCVRRAGLLTKLKESPEERQELIELISDVKTTVAWRDIGGAKANRLAHECNEWYLFHGTNPMAAKSICSTDFKLSFAGDNTGTLYGRGLYFAESITKADEYAKPNADGTYAVLLCRILGGRVRYTDEVSPDPEELVRSVLEGPHDTILGDREKCRGTYREFVIFDTEDVYPEYLIEYRRNY